MKQKLREALKPLIAKVEKVVQADKDVVRIDKNGSRLDIPISNSTSNVDTNTLE